MPQTINSLHTQTRTLQIFAKLSTDIKKRIRGGSAVGKEKYATSASAYISLPYRSSGGQCLVIYGYQNLLALLDTGSNN